MLKALHKQRGLRKGEVLHATDYMDDGSPIALSIAIGIYWLIMFRCAQ